MLPFHSNKHHVHMNKSPWNRRNSTVFTRLDHNSPTKQGFSSVGDLYMSPTPSVASCDAENEPSSIMSHSISVDDQQEYSPFDDIIEEPKSCQEEYPRNTD